MKVLILEPSWWGRGGQSWGIRKIFYNVSNQSKYVRNAKFEIFGHSNTCERGNTVESVFKTFQNFEIKVLKSETVTLKIYCKFYFQGKLVPEGSMAPAHLVQATEEQKKLFELQKENKDLLENITS